MANILRKVFDPLLHDFALFLFFHPAIILSAWYAGPRVGTVAVVLSGLSVLFFWIEPRFSFLIDEPQDLVGLLVFAVVGAFLVVFTDITRDALGKQKIAKEQLQKQKQEIEEAREALRKYANTLEDEVSARTAKLRSTVRDLEEFSYSVSHDLRSPLRAMQGYATVVAEEYGKVLDGNALKYLDRIAAAATRMDGLIEDVLTFSKLGAGGIKLERIDLELLLKELIEQYPQLTAAHPQLEVRPPLLAVRGHRSCLGQALVNLIDNAVKFVSKGATPEVLVWTERRGSQIRICVQDKGIGIAPANSAKIFEVFQQAHGSSYEGTGIGLAIVKKAAEKMGGEVGFESRAGEGSTFWIQLAGDNL
jgi:signal transduction histidine kinase